MHDLLSPEIATTSRYPDVHIQLFEEEGSKELERDVEEEAKVWRNRSPT